jgi:hypothetical protein
VATAQKHFPDISDIIFETKELDICEGEWMEISPECWIDAIQMISSIRMRDGTGFPKEYHPRHPNRNAFSSTG